ncbi:MAG: general secretion pathway protein D, partial [Pseudohongiellaceae bacterium]
MLNKFIKNKNNSNSIKLKSLAAVPVLILLTSCTALSNQSASDGNTAQGAGRTQSAAPMTSQAETAAIESPANTEQMRLMNEINRDGQRVTAAGLADNAPVPVTFDGENIVELNYEQADLRIVIEELAQALDITIVIDPTIDSKISIRTAAQRPLALEDVWPLIRMLSRDAGILIERVGNIYNARKVQRNLPSQIVTPDTLADSSAALLMQVTPLTYVSAEAAIEVVSPILGSKDDIRRLTANNTLIITATEFELDRINQLLMLVDADPFVNQGIQLFQLSNANAEEVATELTEILTLIEGTNPAYQVKGIERINSILVTAPAGRGFNEIERWVRILDAESQEQVEQLFYYKVRNLNAVELAATLTEVFEDDSDDVQTQNTATQLLRPRRLGSGETLSPEQAQTSTSISNNNGVVAADLRVKIISDEGTNSLLIRGTARDYRQLLTTINMLDTVPLQVMINAVIAQVTLTDGNQFGVDWSRIAANSAVDAISTETTTGFVPEGVGGLLFNKSFI